MAILNFVQIFLSLQAASLFQPVLWTGFFYSSSTLCSNLAGSLVPVRRESVAQSVLRRVALLDRESMLLARLQAWVCPVVPLDLIPGWQM